MLINIHEITSLAHGFNWHTPSWDLFVVMFWVVASVVYAIAAGRGRVITILISVYMAKLLVIEAPFLRTAVTKAIPSSLLSVQQLVLFGIIFMLLFILLGRYAFRTSADGRQLTAILFGIIFSFLQIGLLINIVLMYLTPGVQQNFGPLIQTVFIKNPANFIWLIAPLAFLIILGKQVADPNEL